MLYRRKKKKKKQEKKRKEKENLLEGVTFFTHGSTRHYFKRSVIQEKNMYLNN